MLEGTKGFMDQINFNVLGAIIMVQETVAALENNSQLIALGCEQIIEDTAGLVGAFLDLTESVSQSYLFAIQDRFEKLRYAMDVSVVLPVLGTIRQLNQTISGLNITQASYKLMRAKVKAHLLSYEATLLSTIG